MFFSAQRNLLRELPQKDLLKEFCEKKHYSLSTPTRQSCGTLCKAMSKLYACALKSRGSILIYTHMKFLKIVASLLLVSLFEHLYQKGIRVILTGPHKRIAPAGDWTPPICSFETHTWANGHHLVCSSLTLPSFLEPQRGPGRPFSFKRQPLVGFIFVERPNPSQWPGDLWA